jgi:hypothetical protein
MLFNPHILFSIEHIVYRMVGHGNVIVVTCVLILFKNMHEATLIYLR